MIMGDNMERETFIRYIELLHRFEKLSKEELSIYSNTVETKVIGEVKGLVQNDPELLELLKKIHSLPDNERMHTVIEFFAKRAENSPIQENKELEEITQKFNVEINKINHQFLSSGKEIFSFYSDSLGKQVVLENNKNEKIELEMLTKEDILKRYEGFNNITKDDASKVKYLLDNYDNLKITGINLENFICLDQNNILHEAVINKNQEVVLVTPIDANYNVPESKEQVVIENNKDESFDEPVLIEEDKSKSLTKVDKYGFVNNILFVSIAIAVVLIICLVYYVIKYYA